MAATSWSSAGYVTEPWARTISTELATLVRPMALTGRTSSRTGLSASNIAPTRSSTFVTSPTSPVTLC